jgi:Zn finger protein HypA/HybF involved in hydrogenase expression
MKKKSYELKLGCDNCYHGWTQDFPFGSDVEESDYGNGVWCNRNSITCPNCGSFKTHIVSP